MPPSSHSTEPRRVVQVDDNEDLRLAYGLRIDADPGLSLVGQAADGTAALALIREVDPDAVLLDVEMPGPDGREVAALVSATAPDIRIVFFTAVAMSDEEVSRCGAATLLRKPTSWESIRRALLGVDMDLPALAASELAHT